MNTPDKPTGIDEERWREYRDSVIDRVTDKLDELKPVAAAMDADLAYFQAEFVLEAGFDVHKAKVRVPEEIDR